MNKYRANEIHQKAYKEIDELLKRSGMALKGEAILPLIAQLPADRLQQLSDIYLPLYKELQELDNEKGKRPTHAVITKLAFSMLALQGIGFSDDVVSGIISASIGPDEYLSEMVLIMEGHFCHERERGEYENYLGRHDTAMARFIKYHGESGNTSAESRFRSLGWSLHYLQDITAPHHAGNRPVFLIWPSHADTHHEFEVQARTLINDLTDEKQSEYLAVAQGSMESLESDWQGRGKEAFAQSVYEYSAPNIGKIVSISNGDHSDPSCWDEVIDKALPLAIAASAVVLKNSPIAV